MNRLQLLLNKLAEEGAEVAKIAIKTTQFGLHEICNGQPYTNAERAHQELDDLWAQVEMLNEEFGFGYTPNRERIEAKKNKVNQYAAYSERLGMVKQENVPNIQPGRKLFEFPSFDNWCDTAKNKYQDAGVRGEDTLCIDRLGRVCGWGKHFMRARDDNAFPVAVFLLRDDMQDGLKSAGETKLLHGS